jgi:FAD/FMN-containing dehydrogenase
LRLQAAVTGEVLVPGAPGYDEVRKPALVRFHHVRPAAIVRCEDANDVAETLAFARPAGAPVAIRSGGHCFAGRSSSDGIVIDVAPMNHVSVEAGMATVGAGTRLEALNDALHAHGVTLPLGCGPTVGIAGLTLGGGLGILGRKHGLTCDALVAARVVLADGRVVETDEQREPDLFWALRGAGGCRFGVVTELVFKTLPEPEATMFHLVWPHDDAAAVIEAWQAWAPDAPDEMNANLRLPAADPVVHLFGAMLGDEPATLTQLGELIALVGTAPDTSSLNHLPYRAAKAALVGIGSTEDEQPRPMTGRSELLPPPAARGRDRGAGRRARARRAPGAELHAARRRLQPGAGARHGVRPPRRALRRRARAGVRRRRLGGPLLGHDAPVRLGTHLPELPRAGSRRLGGGLPRRQPRPPQGGQAGLRPGRRVQPSLMRCLTFARRSPLPQVSTSS